MGDTSFGLNPEPCASYSLKSRLFCAKCNCEPNIKSAEGRDPIIITVSCHGETETRSISRDELRFTQRVFATATE